MPDVDGVAGLEGRVDDGDRADRSLDSHLREALAAEEVDVGQALRCPADRVCLEADPDDRQAREYEQPAVSKARIVVPPVNETGAVARIDERALRFVRPHFLERDHVEVEVGEAVADGAHSRRDLRRESRGERPNIQGCDA